MTKREGRTDVDLDNLLFYIMGGIIIGARLVHCLIYEPERYLPHPLDIFKIWEGGLASHGGVIGLLIAMGIYIHRNPVNLLWLLDRIAVPSALGGAFVRIGNFLNSEIVGNPTDGSWGVIFEAVDQIPRHPVQLYESASYFIIFAILLTVYKRFGKYTPYGLLTGLFFALVFTARFILEIFKTPQAEYEAGFAITVGQWLSVPFILIGIALIVYALRQGKPSTA
jgi:prolipoprotein diacylglyceryl transferase